MRDFNNNNDVILINFDSDAGNQQLPSPLSQSSNYYKKFISYFLCALNVIYAVGVSALFGGLAYGRKASSPAWTFFNTASSFLINFPMALLFAVKAIDSIKRLKKKEVFYIASFVSAFVLAFGTTIAGLRLADESFNKISFIKSNTVLRNIAKSLSVFNTGTTRFVGSLWLIYSILNWFKNFIYNRKSIYKSYFNLQKDIERYGNLVNVECNQNLSDIDFLDAYIKEFYSAVPKKIYEPGNDRKQFLKSVVTLTISTVIAYLVINITPLWINLTIKGSDELSNGAFKNVFFVLYAAASNQLFYIDSGRKFVTTILNFCYNTHKNVLKKYGEKYDINKVKTVFFAVMALALSTLAGFAFLSGKGFGGEATSLLESWPTKFDPITQNTWFSWLGWLTKPLAGNYDIWAAVVAGGIVNGSAFIRFLEYLGGVANDGAFNGSAFTRFFKCFSVFSEDRSTAHYKAKTLLSSYIGKGELNDGLSGVIQQYRDEALKSKSKNCSSFWSCCKKQLIGEKQHLLEHKNGLNGEVSNDLVYN